MKRFVFVQRCVFALSAGLALLAAACVPIDPTTPGDLVKVLTPFGSELVVPLPGTLEDLSFNVEAQGSWKLEVRYEGEEKDYVQVRPASGGVGNHQITLSVLRNEGDQSRACPSTLRPSKKG